MNSSIINSGVVDLGTFVPSHSGEFENLSGELNFTWRLDPDESFSDWTIVINGDTTYHVHKNYLAVGPRSSKYFNRLFRSDCKEHRSSTSEINLEQSAAEAFPQMLDFVYGVHENVSATTETAIAIRFLATYFGIASLWKNVNDSFIKYDFSIKTAPLYLEEAAIFQDHKIIEIATDLCVNKFSQLKDAMLERLSPNLFQTIVTKLGNDPKSLSSLSSCVAAYCDRTLHMIDADFFRDVTSSHRMRSIDPRAVVTLMRVSVATGLQQRDSSLMDRCREAVSKDWSTSMVSCISSSIQTDHGGSQNSDYHDLPADIRVSLLEKALLAADSALTVTRADRDKAYDELLNFHRVNESHRFWTGPNKVKTVYTGINDEDRPSAMPETVAGFHTHTEEGYIYKTRQGSRTRNYPVFYYQPEDEY